LENKRAEQDLLGSEGGGRRREGNMAQTIYTHVSKCKNGKIK
jgi:hypothetical protein